MNEGIYYSNIIIFRALATHSCDAINSTLGVIDSIIQHRKSAGASTSQNASKIVLNEVEVDVIVNALKLLFNLTGSVYSSEDNGDAFMESEMAKMSKTCQLLLTIDAESSEITETLVKNVINIVSNFPVETMSYLLTPLNRELIQNADQVEFVFEGVVMNVPNTFVEFLFDSLKKVNTSRLVVER